jgi:hypothetical protein
MASSAPSPHDSGPYEDRRAYPRVGVALPAFLHVDGERHSVQLLDVSAGGAKLRWSLRLPGGAAVMLDCGTLKRAAMVRWQNDGLVGLCFDSELDAREVSALIDRSAALAALMDSRE